MEPGIELQCVLERLERWIAEGKDVRIEASRRAVEGFQMVEMWDDREVFVVTGHGRIVEPRVDVSPRLDSAIDISRLRAEAADKKQKRDAKNRMA